MYIVNFLQKPVYTTQKISIVLLCKPLFLGSKARGILPGGILTEEGAGRVPRLLAAVLPRPSLPPPQTSDIIAGTVDMS